MHIMIDERSWQTMLLQYLISSHFCSLLRYQRVDGYLGSCLT